jgi:hypothetical protein
MHESEHMFLLDHILGKPLHSSEDKNKNVGPTRGIAVFGLIFGLDAPGLAAYLEGGGGHSF